MGGHTAPVGVDVGEGGGGVSPTLEGNLFLLQAPVTQTQTKVSFGRSPTSGWAVRLPAC